MHITEFLDKPTTILIKNNAVKASPHITQLMVQIKPQHIKNATIHITKASVPLSDFEFFNASLP